MNTVEQMDVREVAKIIRVRVKEMKGVMSVSIHRQTWSESIWVQGGWGVGLNHWDTIVAKRKEMNEFIWSIAKQHGLKVSESEYIDRWVLWRDIEKK